MFSNFSSIISLAAIAVVAVASGLVGTFALTRRMALAADAISHIALPGIGIAIMFRLDPILGGALMLILGAFLIWFVEQRTKITTETIIGVIFSASLALGGLLINSNEELLDALFGNLGAMTINESIWGIVIGLAVIFTLFYFKDRFVLSFLSRDLAKTVGLEVRYLNLAFLLVFVATVILGLKFLGALLMGSLIIIPAATSRNLAKSFSGDLWIAVIAAVASVFLGMFLGEYFGRQVGPMTIVVSSVFFFVSAILKKKD